MIRILILSLLLATAPACAHQPPAATPVRIICTVATPWNPERCWVEFGQPNAGPKVETSSRADAEELVAILLAKPGAVYVFESGVSASGGPKVRKARERFGQGGAK